MPGHQQAVTINTVRRARHQGHQILARLTTKLADIRGQHNLRIGNLILHLPTRSIEIENITLLQLRQIIKQRRIWNTRMCCQHRM